MYGGTTREDELGRIPSSVRNTMYGGTTWEDPKYSGILSIPDTLSVRWYVWGNN